MDAGPRVRYKEEFSFLIASTEADGLVRFDSNSDVLEKLLASVDAAKQVTSWFAIDLQARGSTQALTAFVQDAIGLDGKSYSTRHWFRLGNCSRSNVPFGDGFLLFGCALNWRCCQSLGGFRLLPCWWGASQKGYLFGGQSSNFSLRFRLGFCLRLRLRCCVEVASKRIPSACCEEE